MMKSEYGIRGTALTYMSVANCMKVITTNIVAMHFNSDCLTMKNGRNIIISNTIDPKRPYSNVV